MFSQLVLALALSQEAGSSGIVKNLEQIEQQLAATWRKSDCAAWAAMLAPEWSVIHIDGALITKAEAVQMCHAARPPIERMTIDQVEVRVYGDAAVVTGRTIMTIAGKEPMTLTIRFTDVFVRGAKGWRVVASHASQVGS